MRGAKPATRKPATRQAAGHQGIGYLLEATTATSLFAAADELGILDRLGMEPVKAQHLAADLGLPVRETTLVLDGLATLGLVERGVTGYRCCTLGPEATGKLAEHVRTSATKLLSTIQTGKRAVDVADPSGSEQLYPNVVGWLGQTHADAAAQVAPLITMHSPAPTAVLDVGAGAAPWSIALAKHSPGCTVTALDLPAVLPKTREAVLAAGLDRRYTFQQGDAFHVTLPDLGYDVILVGNLCHLFHAADNAHLVRRLSRALRPGGCLAFVDVLPGSTPNDRSERARSRALYSLGLATRSSAGCLHSEAEYRTWSVIAGLKPLSRHELNVGAPLPPLSLLIAGKR